MTSAVAILSLKGTLVCGLEQALFNDDEEGGSDFTEFLHSRCVRFSDLSQQRPDNLLPKPPPSLRANPNESSEQQVFKRRIRVELVPYIPLQKKRNDVAVLYTSALPKQLLANQPFFQSQTFSDVNRHLVDRLQKVMFEPMICERDHNATDISLISQIWNEFEIETHRPGWIGFRLSELGTGLWLMHCLNQYDNGIDLHEKPYDIADLLRQRSPALLWQLQYTHARCCTLLRLWQQAIALPYALPHARHSRFTSLNEQALDDRVLKARRALAASPWLSANHHQAQLVHSLIEFADDMFWIPYRWPSKQYSLLLKRALTLCQALEQFYAACLSGFPQVGQENAIASIRTFQAKFCLVQLTQKMLKTLLTQHLKVEAPVRL